MPGGVSGLKLTRVTTFFKTETMANFARPFARASLRHEKVPSICLLLCPNQPEPRVLLTALGLTTRAFMTEKFCYC